MQGREEKAPRKGQGSTLHCGFALGDIGKQLSDLGRFQIHQDEKAKAKANTDLATFTFEGFKKTAAPGFNGTKSPTFNALVAVHNVRKRQG